jgi:hypothetical protein
LRTMFASLLEGSETTTEKRGGSLTFEAKLLRAAAVLQAGKMRREGVRSHVARSPKKHGSGP